VLQAAATRDAGRGIVVLAILLLVALGLRLGWSLRLDASDASLATLPDQLEYLQLARSLLAGDGLQLADARFGDVVHAHRTPGYPLFVALLQGDVLAVRVAQALLDVSTVLATFLLARRWLSPRASLVAATLVALNPYLVYFSSLVLTETLFAAMLAWAMVLLTIDRARVAASTAGWWSGATLLALAILVRPSAIALPLVLGLLAILAVPSSRLPGRRWPLHAGATLVLITFLALLPWAWRNHARLGAWVWTTTNGGITLYDGLHPDATGASDQRFVETMPQLRRMTELERDRYLGDLARLHAREDPARVLRLAGVKALRTWSPVPLSAEYGSRRTYVVAGLAFAAPVLLLALVAAARGPLPRRARLFLLAPAVYLTLVHAASVGSLRYRIPADPPLAILATSALVSLGRRSVPGQTIDPLDDAPTRRAPASRDDT
jgi:4-amino-4-deoxy-L-arabinose transferase-like glycosyltransferase